MKYEEFIATFKKQVYALSAERLLHFALSVCKKLYFDYENFSVKHKWGNADLLMDAINFCEQAKTNSLEKAQVEVVLAEVVAITPDMDEFGDEMASYGLNACIAVQYTLEFLLTKDPMAIVYVGTCLTDTIDFRVQEGKSLNEEQVDNHPLLQETRRQLLEQTR
jgi:uncharacterized protein YjaG (DUF416 family)